MQVWFFGRAVWNKREVSLSALFLVTCPELAALALLAARDALWYFGCKHTAIESIIPLLISVVVVAPAWYRQDLPAPSQIPAGFCRKQILRLEVSL